MKHTWFNISKFCIAQMVSFLKNVMRRDVLEFILRSWDFDCRLPWHSDIVEISSKAQRTCVRLIWPFFFPQEIPLNRSCFSFSGDKMETFERSQVIFHMSLKLKMATSIWWAILELILDSLTFDCKLISWQMWGNLRHCWDLFTNSWEVSFMFLRRSLY